MKTKPEDKPKLMAIGAMLVAVVIYFAVFVIPKLTAGTPTTAPVAAASGSSSSASGITAPAVPQSPGSPFADLYADFDPSPAAGKDPFAAVIAPHADEPVQIAKSTVMPLPGVGQGFGSKSGNLQVMPVAAPQWPAIELQGVMPGDPAMAVIKMGEQIYHKHEGDRLDFGVMVSRITESGVTLSMAKKKMTLEVGHSTQIEKPAASPAAAPGGIPTPTATPGTLPAQPPAKTADTITRPQVETASGVTVISVFENHEPSSVAIAMSEGDQAGLGSNQLISTTDILNAECREPKAILPVIKRKTYRRRHYKRVVHHVVIATKISVRPIGPRPPS